MMLPNQRCPQSCITTVICWSDHPQPLECVLSAVLTGPVELQGGQDLCGPQLHSESWNVETSGVGLCVDAVQEHGPGSTDQVHQGVLRCVGGEGGTAGHA